MRSTEDPTLAPGPPQLPQAPSMVRRLVVSREYVVGQAVIVLIVVLALVGAVGHADGGAQARTESATISVEYPTRIRYKTVGALKLTIEAADHAIEDVSVAVDSSYLDAFSDVSFLPTATAASRQRTVIPVGDIGAHQDRLIKGELRAERYWLHEGWIEVATAEEVVARLPLSTLVLP
jgi:hypothetical protein